VDVALLEQDALDNQQKANRITTQTNCGPISQNRITEAHSQVAQCGPASEQGDVFLTYVERCLVPELRPGEIVIMDNLPAHKVDGVQHLIEATGARLLYLPPYSPDLNPIEMAFAKLKALLRKAAERSVPALWDRIGVLIDQFNQTECANFFRHAGYAAV
jgi:transposase